MKIKLDENLPVRLSRDLSRLGHDVDTAPDEGLKGRTDAEVWAAAQSAGRFFVTMDLDFCDIRQYAPGSHHGVLVVRLPEGPRRGPKLENEPPFGVPLDDVAQNQVTRPDVSPKFSDV
jgi:predicted nuclease of predicted toxin-antitoxin system